ncbi:UDP-glucose flavonoid 3-O-glucosyltransferase 7 [Platanthera zijinensis]|uniref:Glycosyltransferase n=1 Tax=Platanthera zijinensis TaxID=2320716 RepID=A0AAP0FU09_9ASPA
MGSATPADLHMLFFPYMAQGHMLPMVDMARLFAGAGAAVTILTTPANASFIRPTTEGSHPPISLHLIPFPSVAAGLPEGCENRSSLPSDSLRPNFYRALALLRRPFDEALQNLRPDCVVTDMFLPWTYQVAADRGIPRILFDGAGFISRCAEDALDRHRPFDNLPPEADSFVLPCFPHRIEMLLLQTMEYARRKPWPGAEEFEEIDRERKEVNPKNYGVLVNSFYELEPDYVEYYRKVVGRKAWHVGPVALFGRNTAEKTLLRGSVGADGSAGADKSLEWLGGQKPGSVVYVCFGSASFLIREQIREIAAGLEAAGHPFLWVVRAGGEEWLPEGFEERMVNEGKGMVIRGWAQQLAILSHAAVGGFVTHCGWNSTLEGISAGLPMVTWPLFADQFINERLLVDVARVGVAVGSTVNTLKAEDRTLVAAAAVEDAVKKVMGVEEEAEERRRRARELSEKARKAVEKGGSSYGDVFNFIQELLERKAKISS